MSMLLALAVLICGVMLVFSIIDITNRIKEYLKKKACKKYFGEDWVSNKIYEKAINITFDNWQKTRLKSENDERKESCLLAGICPRCGEPVKEERVKLPVEDKPACQYWHTQITCPSCGWK